MDNFLEGHMRNKQQKTVMKHGCDLLELYVHFPSLKSCFLPSYY